MNNLTFETWGESFKPTINENGGSAIFLDDKCISFETYGNDLETIKKPTPVEFGRSLRLT